MKLYKFIGVSLLAVSAGLSSCSSDFLKEDFSTGYNTGFFQTPEGLQSLTLSLYGHIRWIGGYESQGYYQFMGGTDEFGIGTDGSNEMWNTYDVRMAPIWTTFNGNTGTNATIWDEVYYGISSANQIIASADLVTDEAVRNNCLAHAYFIRGFNYYLLTSQYGHCVLQTVPADGIVRSFDLTTEQQCWEQTIADLRKACELFKDESNTLAGDGVSWTRATASHFLAKALLFAASERNSSWNASVKQAYLEEALQAATYTINAKSLENDVIDLYGNWTGVNCAIEKSKELLMVVPQDQNFSGRTGARNPGAFFNPQFSNFANSTLGGMRGCITGGKDFQRFRPTEYALAVFDNVNDARLWKTFGTLYGTAVDFDGVYDKEDSTKNVAPVKIGDPSIVFIINKKDETAYDKFEFGARRYQENANFVDEAGRLPMGGRVQERNGETVFSGKPNQPVLNSWILYHKGQFVGNSFGESKASAMGTVGSNMWPGVMKHSCGYLNAFAGDNGSRDIIIARLGETYLVRAEINVRLGNYEDAKDDINVLRKRGAWHAGENRSFYVDGCYQAATTTSNVTGRQDYVAANNGWNYGANSYYISNPNLPVSYASTEAEMTTWDWDNLPAEDEAILSKLGVSGKLDRAINFILNEHTRELIGEMVRWEHLSRTKTIETRGVLMNDEIKFFDPAKHYLRPIPQSFIDQLQHPDGTNLTDAEKKAWQNPGY